MESILRVSYLGDKVFIRLHNQPNKKIVLENNEVSPESSYWQVLRFLDQKKIKTKQIDNQNQNFDLITIEPNKRFQRLFK